MIRRLFAVLMLLCAAPAARAQLNRFAVLPQHDPELLRGADLLAAALAKLDKLELLERENIQTIAREFELAALVGAEGAGKRLELGRLLAADALIFLTADRTTDPDHPYVRMIITDCRSGARLAQQHFPLPLKDQIFTDRMRSTVESVRSRFQSGVSLLVAVTPFRSRSLESEFNHYQDGLANVLRAALLEANGVALLEVDEVRAVERELQLAGKQAVAGSLTTMMIAGEYRASAERERKRVELQLTQEGGGQLAPVNREFPSFDELISYLRTDYAAAVLQAAGKGGKPLSTESLITKLAERADQFTEIGHLTKAIRLRETILLIKPDATPQALQLVGEYAAVVPFKKRLDWNQVDRESARTGFSERLDFWRRGLRLVARLIGEKRATQAEVLQALSQLDRASSDFLFRANVETDWDRLRDDELLKHLRQEWGECIQLQNDFVAGAALQIPTLSKAIKPEPPPARGAIVNPQANAGRFRTWDFYVVQHPRFFSGGFRATLADRLEHEVWCHTGPLADLRVFSAGYDFRQCLQNPDYHRELKNDYLDGLIDQLEKSPSVAAQIHGRLYRLLFDSCIGRDGSRIPQDAALAKLSEWERCAKDAGFKQVELQVTYAKKIIAPESVPNPLAMPSSQAAQGPQSQPSHAKGPAVRKLDVEELTVRLKWLDGRENTLERSGIPIEEMLEYVIAAGQTDVFWCGRYIFLQKTPGTLTQIYQHERHDHPGVRAVAFDGKYIWAMTCCSGVLVFDGDGRKIAERAASEGLPAAHAGASLAALGPGRVLAAGSFGLDQRAWCGTLNLSDGKIYVDVFHEATTVFTDPKELTRSFADPKTVFIPAGFYRIEPALGQAAKFLLQRRCAGPREQGFFDPGFLAIDVENRSASVMDYRLDRFTMQDASPRLAFRGEDCLVISRDELRIYSYAPEKQVSKYRILLTARNQNLESEFLAFEGSLYLRGKIWYRLDPKSLTVEPLGQWPGDGPKIDSMPKVGVSVHHGLIAWDHNGQYCRIRGAVSDNNERTERDKKVQAARESVERDPKSVNAWKNLVTQLLEGNRCDEASAACVGWIEHFPRRLDARFALYDAERKRRSGLGRWDTDYKLSRGPFPSFAIWRLYNDPPTSSAAGDQLKDALRLPMAEDKQQWLIAEMGLLAAAEYLYSCRKFNETIAVCDQWQREAEQRGPQSDASYLVIRAAAHLRLEQWDEAQRDAEAARVAERSERCWATGADELLTAIAAKHMRFKFEIEPSIYDCKSWDKSAADK